MRAVIAAWRARSPVVVDAPQEVQGYLLERYIEVSLGNVPRGIAAWFAMLFIVAYQAPFLPRAFAACAFTILVGARAWRAKSALKRAKQTGARADPVNDLLMLAAAVCWGLAPFALATWLPTASAYAVGYVCALALAIVGVSFVSALPASVAEVIVGMTPVALFFATRGTVLGGALTIATLSFGSALIGFVAIGHQSLLRALVSERKNARLLEELEQYRRLLERENAALDDSLRRASDAANRDVLTGLSNRRYIEGLAPALAELARVGRETLSLCVFDIDHFKRVNDIYGHPVGDVVLTAVAAQLGARLRESDRLARIGGEEFVAVLRSCVLSRAEAVAGALRAAIENSEIRSVGALIRVTISIGVIEWRPGESYAEAFARADSMLYRAKEVGRNAVVCDRRVPVPSDERDEARVVKTIDTSNGIER